MEPSRPKGQAQTTFPSEETITEAFERFHRKNPAVYTLFDVFTRMVIERGHKSYSADAIFHRIRWHTNVETHGEPFKLNDHYTAYYARMWMRDHPKFARFFRTREQRTL